MLGKPISIESFAHLARVNALLRPFQVSLKELDSLTDQLSKTHGVLSELDLAAARYALQRAMQPALAEVNAILYEHHGFRLLDRIDLTYLHSSNQVRVYPTHIGTFRREGGDAYVRVYGLVVLKSGALGVKEYDFVLQGNNLEIEVI